MKKIISILLTIGMLASLFVVPVSAADGDISYKLMLNMSADGLLGDGVLQDGNGYAIFDTYGDSVTFTFDVSAEDEGYYYMQTGVRGAESITDANKMNFAPALFLDGIFVSTGLTSAAYYPVGRGANPNYGRHYLSEGRHTVKIVNFAGIYNVSGFNLYTIEGEETGTPTVSTMTYAGLNCLKPGPTASFVTSQPIGATLPALMKQSDPGWIKGTLGALEPGTYKLVANVYNYYNGDLDKNSKFTTTLGSYKNENQTWEHTYDTWKEVTLIDNMALAAGSYDFEIKCTGAYTFQTIWDKITLVKTGEIAASDRVEKTFTETGQIGGSDLNYTYTNWATFIANGQTASYSVNIPVDGNYRFTINWDAGGAGAIYWGAAIDGMEVKRAALSDTSSKFGPCYSGSGTYDENQPVADMGIIPLAAGDHILTITRYAGNPAFYPNKATFTKVDEAGALNIEAESFVAETTNGLTSNLGGPTGYWTAVDAGATGHYTVVAPANGFYSVGASLYTYATGGILDVEANGTVALFRAGASEETTYAPATASGDIYLNKGANDVIVRGTGVNGCRADYFTFTPVAWANRTPGVKAAALYAGENVATAIAANTSYTAVADIAGAYIGKPVTLMVGVYAGGKLVAVHKATGKTALGRTIEKTFTTPEAAGEYTVKVFMFDGLSTLKPYTTDATVVNPAVAE